MEIYIYEYISPKLTDSAEWRALRRDAPERVVVRLGARQRQRRQDLLLARAEQRCRVRLPRPLPSVDQKIVSATIDPLAAAGEWRELESRFQARLPQKRF